MRHTEYHDPAELSASLGEWKWDLTRLEGGDFRARAQAVALDALSIMRLQFNRALLHCVQPPLHGVSLLLFGQSAGAVFIDGRKLEAGDCLVMDARSTAEVVSHGDCIAFMISLTRLFWSQAARLSQADGTALRGGSRLVTCDSQSIACLLNGMDSIIAAFAMDSGQPMMMGHGRGYAELMLTRLCAVRTVSRQLHGSQHGRTRRVIGVQRARDYILSHLSDPISLADLCRQTHMQARSLEYGFREILGLSPISYIKVMRLGEVHRRLLSTASHCRSISELALDGGFWHLSQFAVDYKKLFMESPSTTRGRLASHQRKAPTRGPQRRSARSTDFLCVSENAVRESAGRPG